MRENLSAREEVVLMWAEPRESVEQVPCVVTHESPLVPTYGP